jgi:D-tyrosyl-tRNA(Tyr) deacylase
MRAVIQRVSKAAVTIDKAETRNIERGFVILLGVGHEDTTEQADKLWQKILNLRIFPDDEGKTNLNLSAVNGSVMIISQFTLFANCRRGNRPSFTESAAPEQANELYEYFTRLAQKSVPIVKTGEFGAHMDVDLINDGPFTIILDTEDLK